MVHNRYRNPGGEDSVVLTEATLLRHYGHEVTVLEDSNESIGVSRLSGAFDAVWSRRSARRILSAIRTFQPDVVHCHNLFYRLSPSVLWACRDVSLPVVWTLHNYRLACLNAMLLRAGVSCELCVTSRLGLLHGVRYGCFHGSPVESLCLATCLWLHRRIGTYESCVSTFICLSEFGRRKHCAVGLPDKKIVVKPNCVFPDPGIGEREGRYCLFVGRLAAEKGIRALLEAARQLPLRIPVWIVGDGALAQETRAAASNLPQIRLLGPVPRADVLSLMKSARCLLFPSLWYEGCPMTVAEAFSVGLPVVAARGGVAEEMVAEAGAGCLFDPLDPSDLARKTEALWDDVESQRVFASNARRAYEMKYSGPAAYQALTRIYGDAIDGARAGVRHTLNGNGAEQSCP